jgi:hypothetical protein
MLHGYVQEGTYRVSDTYRIWIRVRYASDTYPRSIREKRKKKKSDTPSDTYLASRYGPVQEHRSAVGATGKEQGRCRAPGQGRRGAAAAGVGKQGRRLASPALSRLARCCWGLRHRRVRCWVADAARSAARIRDIPVRRSRLRAPSSPIRLTGTAAPLSVPSCCSRCRRFAWPSEPLPSASTADSPEAARRYLHSPGTARRRRRLKLLAPCSEAGLGLGPESGLGIWGWLKSRVVAWCRSGLAEVKSALYVDFGGPSLGWT